MLGVMVMYTHTRSHTVAIWEGASNYTQNKFQIQIKDELLFIGSHGK